MSRELVDKLDMRASRQSLQSVLDRFPKSQGLRVSDVMVQKQVPLKDSDTLQTASQMLNYASTLAVLSDDGKLSGICDRTCLTAALAKGLPLDAHARDFMSHPSVTTLPEEHLRDAVAAHLGSGLDLIPIVSEDRTWLGMFGIVETVFWLIRQDD